MPKAEFKLKRQPGGLFHFIPLFELHAQLLLLFITLFYTNAPLNEGPGELRRTRSLKWRCKYLAHQNRILLQQLQTLTLSADGVGTAYKGVMQGVRAGRNQLDLALKLLLQQLKRLENVVSGFRSSPSTSDPSA